MLVLLQHLIGGYGRFRAAEMGRLIARFEAQDHADPSLRPIALGLDGGLYLDVRHPTSLRSKSIRGSIHV